MMRSAIVDEQLKLFAEVAALYRSDMMVISDDAVSDPLQALAQFVCGYSFERQGSSPAYAAIARVVIETSGATSAFWKQSHSAREVWDLFCQRLEALPSGTGPNPAVNPLCYRGFSYNTKAGPRRTQQVSAVEFAQKLGDYAHNIVAWARSRLEEARVPNAHGELRTINGVGPKIASFFLRDVAWYFDIEPISDRELLQPIDVWVQRVVRHWDATTNDKEGAWIVRRAQSVGVRPEAVNAGLWYFAAEVAANEYDLLKAVDDPYRARHLVDQHVTRLRRRARAWESSQN